MISTAGCSHIRLPRWIFLAAFLILFSFVLSPVLVGYVHFSHPFGKIYGFSSQLLPTLVRHGTPRSELPTLDIVVSMYQENMTTLAEELNMLRSLPAFKDLEIRTIVYTKDEEAPIASIYAETNANTVYELPNIGREGGTYLSHILLNWDDLARHTFFMQAGLHELDENLRRIQWNFNGRTGVLPLSVLKICRCSSCSDPGDEGIKFPRLAQLYSAVHREFCPEEITMSYGGQVIVSAERIKTLKKAMYMHLKEVLESDGDHWIHGDERQEGRFADEKSNPFFGHTMERSYMVLWNCSDTRIVEDCRQWERLVEEGAGLDPKVPGWCQCLDGAGEGAKTAGP